MKTLLILFSLLFSISGFAQDEDSDMAAFLALAGQKCGVFKADVPCDCSNPAHTAEGSKCIAGDSPCCEKEASADVGADVTACHKYNDSTIYKDIGGSTKGQQLLDVSNQ